MPIVRRKNGSTSRFRGVTLFASSSRYQAFVKLGGKRVHLGMWVDEEAAAIAVDRAVMHFRLPAPLNLPERSRRLGAAPPEELRRQARIAGKKHASSPYFGVAWDKARPGWNAVVCPGDRLSLYISKFERAEDAAVAHDRVARYLLGEGCLLNFPDRDLEPATIEAMQAWSRELRGERPMNRFAGVSINEHGRFRAFVKQDGHWVSVGVFDREEDAATARDRAVLFVGTGEPLNNPEFAERLGPASIVELRRLARLEMKDETTSQYFGVTWHDASRRWRAILSGGDMKTTIGSYESELEAAIAYDRVARKEVGARAFLNFPDDEIETISLIKQRRLNKERRKAETGSRFVGVKRVPSRMFPWQAAIMPNYRTVALGRWRSERKAAIAYDRAALHFRGEAAELNLPHISKRLGPADPSVIREEAHRKFKETTTSEYRGVSWHQRGQAWLSQIQHNGRVYRLGLFDSEVEAAIEYDKAAERIHKDKAKLNFGD